MENQSQTLLDQIQSLLAAADQAYLKDHSEIGKVLGDYLAALQITKPESLKKFTMDYFSIMRMRKSGLQLRPLMIVGPSGVGKVVSGQ